jgi:hypothetical protein
VGVLTLTPWPSFLSSTGSSLLPRSRDSSALSSLSVVLVAPFTAYSANPFVTEAALLVAQAALPCCRVPLILLACLLLLLTCSLSSLVLAFNF